MNTTPSIAINNNNNINKNDVGRLSPTTVVGMCPACPEIGESSSTMSDDYIILNTQLGVCLQNAPRSQHILKYEEEDEDGMTTKKIKFDSIVSVAAIPSHRLYAPEIKEMLYRPSAQRKKSLLLPFLSKRRRRKPSLFSLPDISQRQLIQDPFGLLDLVVIPNNNTTTQPTTTNTTTSTSLVPRIQHRQQLSQKKKIKVLLVVNKDRKNKKRKQQPKSSSQQQLVLSRQQQRKKGTSKKDSRTSRYQPAKKHSPLMDNFSRLGLNEDVWKIFFLKAVSKS